MPFTRLWSGAEDLGHVRSGVDGSQLFFEIAGLIAAATLESKIRDDTRPSTGPERVSPAWIRSSPERLRSVHLSGVKTVEPG